MYALIEFSKSSRVICPMKNILKQQNNMCIAKYSGGKYEAVVIALNKTREELQKIKQKVEKTVSNDMVFNDDERSSKDKEIFKNQKYHDISSMNVTTPELCTEQDYKRKQPDNCKFQRNSSSRSCDGNEFYDTSGTVIPETDDDSTNTSPRNCDNVVIPETDDSSTNTSPRNCDNVEASLSPIEKSPSLNQNLTPVVNTTYTIEISGSDLNVEQHIDIEELLRNNSLNKMETFCYDTQPSHCEIETPLLSLKNAVTSTPEDFQNLSGKSTLPSSENIIISTVTDWEREVVLNRDSEISDQVTESEFNQIIQIPQQSEAFCQEEGIDDTNDDPNYDPEEHSFTSVDTIMVEVENQNENINKLKESTNDSGGFDVSTSMNVPGMSACDDTNMYVEKSRGHKGDKKYNFCYYCKTKQSKIARHLQLKHRDEEDVQKFVNLEKRSLERRNIIDVIRKKGNFVFNTNQDLNTGELIVSRRPKSNLNRAAKDFMPCGNCKGYFAKSSLRTHFRKCTGKSCKNNRVVMVMGKKVMGRIHSRASETVRKELFPRLREDDVVRSIRYDELVIIYANKMCEKYKNLRHYEMIRQRIRLLGRFLLTIRSINKEVSDFTSVYDPKYCDDTLKAINIEAHLDSATDSYETPTVAFQLGSLLKQVGNILINECIKKHDHETKENATNFLQLLAQEVAISVNRTVVESQVQYRRRKKVELPSKEDIQKLHTYLTKRRNETFEKLKDGFNKETWMELAEVTLVSIQLFNRRRAGEVERILIDDFNSYQGIDNNVDENEYKKLSKRSQEIAQKYVRFAIRGKLNRTVTVLLDNSLLQCVKLLLSHRKNAKVSSKNPYIFGIPGGEKSNQKYLRACNLIRRFSLECGATHPERLRGTKLRKHVATICMSLNLSENEVADLANFMGHAEKIHKNIYRQPIINREILTISKYLEIAQGANEDDSDDSDESDDSDDVSTNEADETGEIIAEPIIDVDNLEKTDEGQRKRLPKSCLKKKRSTSPYGPVKRRPWTKEEKKAVFRLFGDSIKKMKLPSLRVIQKAITENPCLQNRTSPQIKTWISNQFQAKKKLTFTD